MKRSMFLTDNEVERLVSAEKDRLMQEADLNVDQKHYHCIEEFPFTPEERATTTILLGNLTWKHEVLIKAVFEGGGYRFQNLPAPTKVDFRIGKEYCNNGLCNPNYFTAGSLIQYLGNLEAKGLTRQEIIRNYVCFTAADCGPCRFGMYESEYRQALHNAGFPGFRVLTFRNNTVIREGSKEPGLKFSMDLGMGILNALILGDLLYQAAYQIRPNEACDGNLDLEIRLSESVSTKQNKSGDYFEATLDKDLIVDGEVVVPRKSRITGKLVEVKNSGRVKGRARMALTLAEIEVGAKSYPIQTNKLVIEAEGTKGSDAKKIGAAAGIGALIGVITGGGGAALGSVIGAGSGTARVLLTKGKDVSFGPEHRFLFRLKEDVIMRID